MKRLELKPDGFPCTLVECPPGFFLKDDEVGFKSKYGVTPYKENHQSEAFCETGCYFWGGDEGKNGQDLVVVQPLISEWTEK